MDIAGERKTFVGRSEKLTWPKGSDELPHRPVGSSVFFFFFREASRPGGRLLSRYVGGRRRKSG